MGLDLPNVVWFPLAGETLYLEQLAQVDSVAQRLLQCIANHKQSHRTELAHCSHGNIGECDSTGNAIDWIDEMSYATYLSDGTQVPLIPNGDSILVKDVPRVFENLSPFQIYSMSSVYTRLCESYPMLQFLSFGLNAVLPMELFP